MEDIKQHQESIKENILKAFVSDEESIEKARHGIYANTSENQKLNRVGQEYGKKGEEKESTSDTKTKGDADKLKSELSELKAQSKKNPDDEKLKTKIAAKEEQLTRAAGVIRSEGADKEKKKYENGDIEKYARETTTETLEKVANGKDEKLRIAAKKELERRETEHKPETKKTAGGEKPAEKRKSIKELESQTPGYLNLKESKDYYKAKENLDEWHKGKLTQYNKSGYDTAQRELAKTAEKYIAVLESNTKKGDKTNKEVLDKKEQEKSDSMFVKLENKMGRGISDVVEARSEKDLKELLHDAYDLKYSDKFIHELFQVVTKLKKDKSYTVNGMTYAQITE